MNLYDHIQAIQAQAARGDRLGAVAALRQLLLEHPDDAQLWRLFVELADERDDQRFGYENILRLEPNNIDAKRKLARLGIFGGGALQIAASIDASNTSSQPQANIPKAKMRQWGIENGDVVRLANQDGETLSVIAQEGNSEGVQLNAQAARLLAWSGNSELGLLPNERLILAVDSSTSMGSRLNLRRTRLSATREAIEKLLAAKVAADEIGDAVGLVVFHTIAQILAEPSTDYERIRTAARTMHAHGATDLYGGIQTSLHMLTPYGGLKRIILLTDGSPTTTSPAQVRRLAKVAADAKVVIDTVGLGKVGQGEYNEALLRAIAEITGGTFRHVDDLSTLEESFIALAAEKRLLLKG